MTDGQTGRRADGPDGIRFAAMGRQAQAVGSGVTLYEQLRYGEFMATREQNPSRTFRQHLEEIGAAIEV